MGRLNTTQADADSFERLINSLSITQIFLLRSMEINQSKWSGLAAQELKQNYSDLWNLYRKLNTIFPILSVAVILQE